MQIIPAVLSPEQLTALRTDLAANNAPWVDGRVTAGHQGMQVKNNLQIDEASELAQRIGDLILTSLQRNPAFISAALPLRVYPPMVNRYSDGMAFGSHVDGAIRTVPMTGQRVRTDLSATLFLADPDSYDGGELVIEDGGATSKVKLDAGDMILYSAGTRHSVMPVTRGVRLASFFWIQSMVRDTIRRTELFDLDQAVQRLTRTGADADALVALTNHYHNLLRMWSEV